MCAPQEAAWEKRNALHKYCFVCSADYTLSWEYAPIPLPPQRAGTIADYRRDANIGNNSAAARETRRNARQELDSLHLRPEVTPIDRLAIVHTGGAYNMMPDPAHIVEGGIAKCAVLGLKAACDDKAGDLCDHGHGIPTTVALIDDIVKTAGGHNTGEVSEGDGARAGRH